MFTEIDVTGEGFSSETAMKIRSLRGIDKMRNLISWCRAVCVCAIAVAALGHVEMARAASAAPASCDQFSLDSTASSPLQQVTLPPTQQCNVGMSHGFPIPDPACTPGAINPTLTADVLRNPEFRTGCVRNNATTEQQKNQTYGWYSIPHPSHNTGASQTCELDHLISLELGGADTLDNIWPQCGPADAQLRARYFKEKDAVENYLAKQVKTGATDLGAAQQGIATDWTQYLDAAQAACPGGRC